MNTQYTARTIIRILTLLVAVGITGVSRNARAACAQIFESGSHAFDFGNSTAGVDGSFSSFALLSSPDCPGDPYALARASGSASLKLFQNRFSIFEAEAEARNTSAGPRADLRVEIGGMTLVNAASSHTVAWSRSYPITLVEASSTFFVGAYPVILDVSVGAGIDADVALDPEYPVTLSGHINPWATGTSNAHISASNLRARSQSILDVLDTTLSSSLALSPSGASGGVTINFRPVRFFIRLVVERRTCSWSWRGYRCTWKQVAARTLVDDASGSYSRMLLGF